MSLDVYLESDTPFKKARGSGIFVRESGDAPCVEISEEEWFQRFPDREPARVRRDDNEETSTLYSRNITHNLTDMAEAAGLYKHLWRPEEIGITKARELILPLVDGLERLRADADKFKKFNPENGWGTYEGLVKFVSDYVKACCDHPAAKVRVCR